MADSKLAGVVVAMLMRVGDIARSENLYIIEDFHYKSF